MTRDPSPERAVKDAFRQGLGEHGWVEGQNIVIVYGYRNSGHDPAVGLAELLRHDVKVIVAGGDSTIKAATKLTTTIPIVMSSSGDPVGNGSAQSLARPGRNVTGLSNYDGASQQRVRSVMLVEPDYRGFRIQVDAELIDGVWNARVRIRRTLSEEKPHVEAVTCRKPTAKEAEERAAVWARRWVDRQVRQETQ